MKPNPRKGAHTCGSMIASIRTTLNKAKISASINGIHHLLLCFWDSIQQCKSQLCPSLVDALQSHTYVISGRVQSVMWYTLLTKNDCMSRLSLSSGLLLFSLGQPAPHHFNSSLLFHLPLVTIPCLFVPYVCVEGHHEPSVLCGHGLDEHLHLVPPLTTALVKSRFHCLLLLLLYPHLTLLCVRVTRVSRVHLHPTSPASWELPFFQNLD